MIVRATLAAFAFLIACPLAAYAANCDQFHTDPTDPSAGPLYSGVSPMPLPPPGPRPVLQWACFFKNTSKIISVSGTVLDPHGQPAPFPQYSADFNYTYYPDQTEVKLSFQKLPESALKKLRATGWSLSYRVEFDKSAAQPVASAIAGAAACINRTCVVINTRGNNFYVNTDDNTLVQNPNPASAKAPMSVTCQEGAAPSEPCLMVDANGQLWAGQPRPPVSWTSSGTIGTPQDGPFAINCDNTRWCLIVGASGKSWRGRMEADHQFVGGPTIPK